MTVTTTRAGHLPTRSLADTVLAALCRRRPDMFRTTVSGLLGLSWTLHLLIGVDVLLAAQRRRDAVDLLAEGGFTVRVGGPDMPAVDLPLSAALVIRPKPVDDQIWRWQVAYDTHLPVPAAATIDPRLSTVASWTAATATGVALEPSLAVLAAVGEIGATWPTRRHTAGAV